MLSQPATAERLAIANFLKRMVTKADGLVQERRAAEKRIVRNQQLSKTGEATSGTVTDCIFSYFLMPHVRILLLDVTAL